MTVFGTRPEAIKMAPVALALHTEKSLRQTVCITGQHRQMLDQVMRIFELRADIDLNVMKAGQDLCDVTSSILLGMRAALRSASPDLVLVHGDTTTCFAATLAAFYHNVPVGHVEAGLRTNDLRAPFPEEGNRVMVGRLARLHFAPTTTARDNLLAEGIPASCIHVTGNTVIDALMLARDRIRRTDVSLWQLHIGAQLVDRIARRKSRFVLITGHRRENFGQGLIDLCQAIRQLAESHPDWLFVYPVHLNPNVLDPVHGALGGLANVHLIEPVEYLPFVWLMDNCDLILTDSGGIQEEGPTFGKPVLVTRDVTERPEAIAAGTVRLVGTDPEKIIANIEQLLGDESAYRAMATATNPYGDGTAAERIVGIARNFLRIDARATQEVPA
jgi:UDP-N-acetylglucosamine 2-epimerase (non-hydrolysing)